MRAAHAAASQSSPEYQLSGDHLHHRTILRLLNLNTRRKRIFQFIQMCNYQNFSKILADQVNGFDQALASFGVLRTKALIDHQSLQTSAGPLR